MNLLLVRFCDANEAHEKKATKITTEKRDDSGVCYEQKRERENMRQNVSIKHDDVKRQEESH